MTRNIHDLAELQPNIQMAQALYLDQGPYADIRETVDQLSKKYLNNGTEHDEDNESDDAIGKEDEPTSGDQRCPRCKQSVPYHALAYHTKSCSGPEQGHVADESKKDQPLSEKVFSSEGGTLVAAAGPVEQRYQTLLGIL